METWTRQKVKILTVAPKRVSRPFTAIERGMNYTSYKKAREKAMKHLSVTEAPTNYPWAVS